jgi:hypothetical protein
MAPGAAYTTKNTTGDQLCAWPDPAAWPAPHPARPTDMAIVGRSQALWERQMSAG